MPLMATVLLLLLCTASVPALVSLGYPQGYRSQAPHRGPSPRQQCLMMDANLGSAAAAPPLFGDLPLPRAIADALYAAKITTPTRIQEASSMNIHRGSHTLLHSETGSGKTLAYLLPLLARLHVSRPGQLIVVVPSRELALQTAAIVEQVWPHHGTRRAFILAGTAPAEIAEQLRLAACPVVVATPRPLLALVRHLAGTDRLHSRRAIAGSGEALTAFSTRLRAIVLDEADALLLDRELAIAPPRRKSYEELSGGKGSIKAPERFTKATAKAVQALLKAQATRTRAPLGRATQGRRGRGRGRGGRRGVATPHVQLVACSATASYRLREELCRLFEIPHEGQLAIISPADSRGKKRAAGERGLGGIGVPPVITHWWVGCSSNAQKASCLATVLSSLRPRVALLFLEDDEPLRATVAELCDEGLDAQMLHEAMGFGSDANGADSGALTAANSPDSGGFLKLQSSLQHASSGADGSHHAAIKLSSTLREATGDDSDDDDDAVPRSRLLVSTMSSARGLDLANVDCVLLYSLPAAADQYLHLAGRCGRQGRAGSAVSLLTPEQVPQLGSITRQLGISIKANADLALAMEEARRKKGP